MLLWGIERTMSKQKHYMKQVAGFVLALAAIPLNAWCVQVLWGWFIVPQFGLAPLDLLTAFGLSLFASFMTKNWDYDEENRDKWKSLGVAYLRPLIALGAGGTAIMIFG